MKRTLLFTGALFALFFLPWYLTVAAAIAGFFYFDNYYEGILIGLIYDSLYFTASSGSDVPVVFFGSIVVFFLFYFIRPYLRKYA
ncbi:MAG: hypothetical protein ACI88L_000728 [Candidatus Paceibacteria bacterium]|jgi:hypothetical protein